MALLTTSIASERHARTWRHTQRADIYPLHTNSQVRLQFISYFMEGLFSCVFSLLVPKLALGNRGIVVQYAHNEHPVFAHV
jgi:hypothetical protein